MKTFSRFLVLAIGLSSNLVKASSISDPSFLDAPYRGLQHPVSRPSRFVLPTASNTESVIEKMTPVRSQGSRGTCSIFSATAMAEAMMVIRGYADTSLDLSEEWLEYLIVHNRTTDGSSSNFNYAAFARNGVVEEATLPYIGETWTSAEYGLAADRCGQLHATALQSCLLAHRNPSLMNASEAALATNGNALYDPEFLAARKEAKETQTKIFSHVISDWYVGSVEDAKTLLASGIPVTLDLDFFYGAWNHREASDFGIGRDLGAWAHGWIGYPEPGSVDRVQSPQHPAGHSILVVGYDDQAQIKTNVLMTDGTMKEFTYTGVYYFKNSWGTGNFGTDVVIGGVSHPGYGVITQQYAHEFGSFFKLPLPAQTPVSP